MDHPIDLNAKPATWRGGGETRLTESGKVADFKVAYFVRNLEAA